MWKKNRNVHAGQRPKSLGKDGKKQDLAGKTTGHFLIYALDPSPDPGCQWWQIFRGQWPGFPTKNSKKSWQIGILEGFLLNGRPASLEWLGRNGSCDQHMASHGHHVLNVFFSRFSQVVKSPRVQTSSFFLKAADFGLLDC